MTLTLADLYASPDHYLHSFDGDAAVFVPMDRAAYHRSIFLDARISPADEGALRVPVAALIGSIPAPAATAWIMHVAHCGSTLLARALDHIDANLVLREPQALRQLAFVPEDQRLALTVAMLSKRYRSDTPTIVKGNVPTNFLLARIAGMAPDSPAIFLYLPLRDYLLAILRSDNHRTWLRTVTNQLGGHVGPMPDDASDAVRAAALWLAQMRVYASAAERMANARSLDAEVFFAEPVEVLNAAAAHFAVPLSPSEIEVRVAGPLFATYSKNPSLAFGNAERIARRQVAQRDLAPELAEAERWIGAHETEAAAHVATLAAIPLIG
ncbi:hypothetical protein [Sphingomonas sp. M1A8_2b]